ncbi:hypothetical protein [Streptococcus hepaticus]|uniref:hypothetical protein n=1 Tax=Streptococcus hepaticus TaxID=3349163 RepID=UPI003D161846
MELRKNTTELIELKDRNIKIEKAIQSKTHITITTKLDYQVPPNREKQLDSL